MRDTWLTVFAWGVVALICYELYRRNATGGIITDAPQGPGALNIAPGAALVAAGSLLGAGNLPATNPLGTTVNVSRGSAGDAVSIDLGLGNLGGIL